jgi:hypothetical protein
MWQLSVPHIGIRTFDLSGARWTGRPQGCAKKQEKISEAKAQASPNEPVV